MPKRLRFVRLICPYCTWGYRGLDSLQAARALKIHLGEGHPITQRTHLEEFLEGPSVFDETLLLEMSAAWPA